MNDSKDKKPAERPEPTAVGDGSQGSDKRSGRVSHDARGNPVWEWQLETGVYSRDVSTHKLKKLDLGDLSLAETAQHKRPAGLGGPAGREKGTKEPMPGGGFNPYDNTPSAGGGGFNPYDNARALGNKMRPSQPSRAPRSPADLKKLEEWMKLKKKVEGKDEDE
jgi:hypothetical protein